MKKIPTLYVRDWDGNPKHVTREVNPECQWVLDGEGRATRKYDGTCVLWDGIRWWARREVKPGKVDPPNFLEADRDDTTGKRIGWEPVEQSSFARYHAEALTDPYGIAYDGPRAEVPPTGTYELIGPKVNGDPERTGIHLLVRHGYMSANDLIAVDTVPLTFDGLAAWLATCGWEGLVWHHPDGRMAKLKAKDFPR